MKRRRNNSKFIIAWAQAMAQHLMQAKRRGDRDGSLWEVFWKGGKADGCEEDERSLALVDMSERPLAVFKSMVWGVSLPWTLACASLIGVWLTLQPAFLGSPRDATGPGLLHFGATDIFHLVGALVVVTSVISMGEVLRAGRFLNVPLALLVAIAPWCFPSSTILGSGLRTCSGIAILPALAPVMTTTFPVRFPTASMQIRCRHRAASSQEMWQNATSL